MYRIELLEHHYIILNLHLAPVIASGGGRGDKKGSNGTGGGGGSRRGTWYEMWAVIMGLGVGGYRGWVVGGGQCGG